MKFFYLALATLLSFPLLACDGGMTMNKEISIPAFSSLANNITEKEYKDTLRYFERFFLDKVDLEHNAELIVMGSWSANGVNAFTEQEDGKMIVVVNGGLARHKAITPDGLMGVLCHELGHHLGGYPKKTTNRWSSAEGQADYYATMKCLRTVWEKTNNIAAMTNQEIPAKLKEECGVSYKTPEDQALCHRVALSGYSVALMIQDLDHDSIDPKFETPDPTVRTTIDYLWPYAQCRLDTFFQGSICPVSKSVEFDERDEKTGACHQKSGDSRGMRPLCWFVPQN